IVHSASSMRKIKKQRISTSNNTKKGEPPVSDPPLCADIYGLRVDSWFSGRSLRPVPAVCHLSLSRNPYNTASNISR
ncbi:hypothetical protein VPJ68_04625, partial [Parabacteroides distasonis]